MDSARLGIAKESFATAGRDTAVAAAPDQRPLSRLGRLDPGFGLQNDGQSDFRRRVRAPEVMQSACTCSQEIWGILRSLRTDLRASRVDRYIRRAGMPHADSGL